MISKLLNNLFFKSTINLFFLSFFLWLINLATIVNFNKLTLESFYTNFLILNFSLHLLNFKLISFFSIILGVYFISQTINLKLTFSKKKFYAGFIYILLMNLGTNEPEYENFCIANCLILWSLLIIINTYNITNVYLLVFYKAGLMFSLAVIIYPKYILLYPIIYISLLLVRQFNLKEWVSLFFGMLTLIFILFCMYYLIHGTLFNIKELTQLQFYYCTQFQVKLHYKPLYFTLGLLLCFTIYRYLLKQQGDKTILVKVKYIIIWLLIISLQFIFLDKNCDFSVQASTIPMSIMFGNVIHQSESKKIYNLFTILLLLSFSIIYLHQLGVL